MTTEREPQASPRRVVVIDDDPTGGQTVAAVPVVTRWEPEDLRWLLTRERTMGFVLTNSRAMTAERAGTATSDIVRRCVELGAELDVDVSFVSRSDSTLRGHFCVEVGSICTELREAGRPADVVLLVPAFFEAGRITRDNLHYVRSEGIDVPVADTAYAQDPAFGFAESNLIDWVRARLGAPKARVSALSLTDIRDGGPTVVGHKLRAAARDEDPTAGPPVLIVNATQASDYRVVAEAVEQCEGEGLVVVTRSGPSYLSARLGEPLPPAVEEIPSSEDTASHGLIVVGSHVPLSTAQLDHLVASTDVQLIELVVSVVLGASRNDYLEQLTASVTQALGTGHVALATSRGLHHTADAKASLEVAEAVSSAVDEVVTRVIATRPPAWIVAKGGITSANMVTKVLQLRRGWIVGQIFAGQLPLWRDDSAGGAKPLCVIFPGNVGTESTLTEVVRKLDRKTISASD